MIGRRIAQDTSAASNNTAAIAMAIMAETAMETGMIVVAGVGAAEAMAEMALALHASTAIRMESTMARATGAAATAIVQRKTAITNTPTVATAQAMATKITTNKLTARLMKADIKRDTTAVAAGAGTNPIANDKGHAAKRMAFFYGRFFSKLWEKQVRNDLLAFACF